jgi:pimeloyl-ACP methyl ester carboxylesterase
MPILLVLGVLTLIYVLIAVIMYLVQDRFVFPSAGRGDRGLPVLPRMAVGKLTRGKRNEHFRIVTVRAEEVHAVLVCFVGNGEDLYDGAELASVLSRYGLLVIAAEYPGYGGSDGWPGVASILECADAAGEQGQLTAKELGVPLFVAGSSLGSFPAVHLASKGIGERLLLRAPPTSLVAAASLTFWWLPIRLLLRHQFDSLALARSIQCPALIVHGSDDDIVPAAMGRELAAAMPHGEFVAVPGFGHNDVDLSPSGPVGEKVAAFLRAGQGR